MHFLARKKDGPYKSPFIMMKDGKNVFCHGGEYVIPCDTKRRRLEENFRATVACSCVTCEECMKSQQYIGAKTAQGEHKIAVDHVSPAALKALQSLKA